MMMMMMMIVMGWGSIVHSVQNAFSDDWIDLSH